MEERKGMLTKLSEVNPDLVSIIAHWVEEDIERLFNAEAIETNVDLKKWREELLKTYTQMFYSLL